MSGGSGRGVGSRDGSRGANSKGRGRSGSRRRARGEGSRGNGDKDSAGRGQGRGGYHSCAGVLPRGSVALGPWTCPIRGCHTSNHPERPVCRFCRRIAPPKWEVAIKEAEAKLKKKLHKICQLAKEKAKEEEKAKLVKEEKKDKKRKEEKDEERKQGKSIKNKIQRQTKNYAFLVQLDCM